MQWMLDNWFLVVTAAVAVYGAVHSTVIGRRERRRRLKVKLSHGFITHGPDMGPDRVILMVANPGRDKIRVTTGLAQFPDGAGAIFPFANSEVRLPHDLEPEASLHMWMSAAELARGLKERGFSNSVELRGIAVDAVGREHRGRTLKFQLDAKYEDDDIRW